MRKSLFRFGNQADMKTDIMPVGIERGCFDGLNIAEFCRDRETPFYLLSERKIAAAFKRFTAGIDVPRKQVFYSLKTNYQTPVLHALLDAGCGVEVYHRMELEIALAAGWEGSRIIMDGPGMNRSDLQAAVENRVSLINIESWLEMVQLNSLAGEAGIVQPIGIRVRFGFRTFPGFLGGVVARRGKPFGIPLSALGRIFQDIKDLKHLLPVCVSGHIPLPAALPRHFAGLIRGLFSAATLARSYGLPIDRIDIGGGYPPDDVVRLRLLSAFRNLPMLSPIIRSPKGGTGPVLKTVSRAYQENARGHSFEPLLILEPGRCLVDDAMVVVGRVLQVEDRTALVDISTVTELAYLPAFYARTISVLNARDGSPRSYRLCGPTLNPFDVIDTRLKCPTLRSGDLIVISSVGAYCANQSRSWMLPRCACYMIDRQGSVRLSRRKETAADILRTQC